MALVAVGGDEYRIVPVVDSRLLHATSINFLVKTHYYRLLVKLNDFRPPPPPPAAAAMAAEGGGVLHGV